MSEWKVVWMIDSIEADHRLAAARKARRMTLDPRSTAVIFDVECRDPELPGAAAIDLDLEGSKRWGSDIDMNDLAQIICRRLTRLELAQLSEQIQQELVRKLRKEQNDE